MKKTLKWARSWPLFLVTCVIAAILATTAGRNPVEEVEASHPSADRSSESSEIQEETNPYLEVARKKDELGKEALSQGDLEKAQSLFRESFDIRERLVPESRRVAVSLNHLGNTAREKGNYSEAESYFHGALDILERIEPRGILTADTSNNLGIVMVRRGDLVSAKAWLRRAMDLQVELAPNSPKLANILNNLGYIALSEGNLDEAESKYEDSLAMNVELAPNSFGHASALNGLGTIAHLEGNLDLAEQRYLESLAIKEAIAPRSSKTAITLDNLGIICSVRGDYEDSDEYHLRSLAISRRAAPSSVAVAKTLEFLGTNARERGDLVLAEDYLRRASEIYLKLAPDSPDLVTGLVNLGILDLDRADLDQAEYHFQRALSISETPGFDRLRVVSVLTSLGSLATRRHDDDRAVEYFQDALGIYEKMSPNSIEVAGVLDSMGLVERQRGRTANAEIYYQRSLDVLRKVAPASLQTAGVLIGMGSVAQAKKDLDLAERYYRESLTISEKLAPGGLNESAALHKLGKLSYDRRQLERAAEYFGRAVSALEEQVERLGGSYRVDTGFRAQHEDVYRDAARVYLKMDRPEDAFYALEKFRARNLLLMLSERDLVFSIDIPEELDRERRNLARQYDNIYRQISRPRPEMGGNETEAFLEELKRLRREREGVEVKIRKASRKFANLRYSLPLKVRDAQEMLDPGTIMLAYSVAEEQTDLFVVTKDDGLVLVEMLPVAKKELRAQVDRFRHAISSASESDSPFYQPMKETGKRLFELLIRPAADVVERSDRVLVVPDGRLHLLPFGALILPTGEYLTEWKPLHSVVSATLYSELTRTRLETASGQSSPQLVAFGDPRYPKSLHAGNSQDIPEPRVRSAVERSLFEWEPLPYSRGEVETIAGLFPPGHVRTYLGEDATEEQAKVAGKSADILHFAVHGYLDDRFPLDSGLALTLPEDFSEDRDNGLLQAWEIFESVRLDADLVVLSACQTALGEQRGGEGLIGLVRAFQYAGARTVAASLWNVSDQVTAELMVRFYRHLRAGKSKDVALQAAQIELIRGGAIEVENASGRRVPVEASAPYFWAGFQIIGDWQSRSP